MEGDGDGNGHADLWVFQGGQEGGQSFREVVEGDRKGGEERHAVEFFPAEIGIFGLAAVQGSQGRG